MKLFNVFLLTLAGLQTIIAQKPSPFLEGNPIWVYKYENISVARDPSVYCWIDEGNRRFAYYFLGGQEEIEGKVYTMMGEVIRDREGGITLNRWLPVREENGIVYAITDSLLFPQNEGSKVKSFDTYQLLDGTECRVMKTNWGRYDLYEKIGFLSDDFAGIMDPLLSSVIPTPTNGSVYSSRLNAYYQGNTMLYKAPDAPEGLCVNDTCWTRDDAEAYAVTYKADPRQEEVFAYIRQLQKGIPSGITIKDSQTASQGTLFDLQGRKLQGKPSRGIYIENGQKKVVGRDN